MSPAVWAAFVAPREVTGARKGTRSPAEHWHGANFVSVEDQKDRCGASALGTLTFNTFPGAGQRILWKAGHRSIHRLHRPSEAEASYGDTDSAESAMDTEKTDQTKGGDGQTEAKKPVIEQMTDLAAAAAGALAESAVKAVARKTVKAVAKRAPAKNVVTRVAKAARTPKKTTKKAVKKVTKKAKKSAKKAMPKRATKKVKKKSSKKSKR